MILVKMKKCKGFLWLTTYLAIPNPEEKIEVAQVTQKSVKDRRLLELNLSLPIKTLQIPESTLNPTMLSKISMKVEGTDSKNISITPILEKWFIFNFSAWEGDFFILLITLSESKKDKVDISKLWKLNKRKRTKNWIKVEYGKSQRQKLLFF